MNNQVGYRFFLSLNCGKDSSPCEAVHWTERSEGSG